MKQIKKVLSVVLVLVMILSSMAIGAFAAPADGKGVGIILVSDKTEAEIVPGEVVTVTLYLDLADWDQLVSDTKVGLFYNTNVYEPILESRTFLGDWEGYAKDATTAKITPAFTADVIAGATMSSAEYDSSVMLTAAADAGLGATSKAGFSVTYDEETGYSIAQCTIQFKVVGDETDLATYSKNIAILDTYNTKQFVKVTTGTSTAKIHANGFDASRANIMANMPVPEEPACDHTDNANVDWNGVDTATCGAGGTQTGVCALGTCEETFTRTTPATGKHTYDEGVVTTAPTHTTDGVMTFTCECGDTYTRPIPANADDHTYDEGVVTTAPTHTEKGVKTFTCACGDTYTEEIPANVDDHTYDEGVVTTAPTHTEKGVKTFTCECGKTYTEAIPALKLSVKHAGSQISFNKDGSFNVRAVAAIKKADFLAAFGSEEEAMDKITSIGFVFAAGSNVAAPDMALVKAMVENGATDPDENYTKMPVSSISRTLVSGYYSFTCLVRDIGEEDKTNSLVAVAYVAWDNDGDGVADSYAYYDNAKTVSYESLYNKYFPG